MGIRSIWATPKAMAWVALGPASPLDTIGGGVHVGLFPLLRTPDVEHYFHCIKFADVAKRECESFMRGKVIYCLGILGHLTT
jgi:hypothetical protein